MTRKSMILRSFFHFCTLAPQTGQALRKRDGGSGDRQAGGFSDEAFLRTGYRCPAEPVGAVHGIGDVDDKRIERSISLMVDACRLPRTPKAEAIFTRAFLPPLEERAKPVKV